MPYYYYGFDPTYFLVIIGAVICMIASARDWFELQKINFGELERRTGIARFRLCYINAYCWAEPDST